MFSLLDDLCSPVNQKSEIQQDKQTLLIGIQHHLSCLLNTRRGALSHLPEYGLQDVNALYQALYRDKQGRLEGAIRIQKAVARLLRCYEPRLNFIHLEIKPSTDPNTVLALHITATLQDEQCIRCVLYFQAAGKVDISQVDRVSL